MVIARLAKGQGSIVVIGAAGHRIGGVLYHETVLDVNQNKPNNRTKTSDRLCDFDSIVFTDYIVDESAPIHNTI